MCVRLGRIEYVLCVVFLLVCTMFRATLASNLLQAGIVLRGRYLALLKGIRVSIFMLSHVKPSLLGLNVPC